MFNSGIRGRRAKDGEGTVSTQSRFVQKNDPQPTISSYTISGIDDTAVDPAGGQTIVVTGTGFATGISGTLGGTQIGAVTFVSSTQVTFAAPALSSGTYALVLYNSTGGAAILVPGIAYSSVPTYTTAAGSIGTVYETKSINTSVVATSDSAITYSLVSGTLPTGASLNSNGTITGTAPVDSASTTYTFSIKATDTELQDVTRTFTLTVNTDVVTWATPTNGSTITLDGTNYSQALSATAASGYSVSYSANSLPTGLTLSSGTISGSPTVEGTSTTLLTATAATSNRTGTNTITWVVILGDNYWNYATLLLNGSTPTTSFINDASLNNAQVTIQGDTKPNNFNPYTQGYYSNYFDGTGDYLSSTSNASITTGPFTFECWIYPTALGTNRAIINNGYWNIGDNGGYRLFFTSGNQIQLQASTGTWNTFPTVIQSSTTITAAYRWYHIAIVRDVSNNINLYINGVVAATPVSYSASLNLGAGQTLKIGGSIADGSLYDPWLGYISNMRIVNGTAIYTSAFTPSTEPLTAVANTQLLTCQSNRFIDNSTNNFALTKNGDTTISSAHPFIANSSYSTYGSAYFDGTGDYLSAPYNPAYYFGTGDFTIDFWMYITTAWSSNSGPGIGIKQSDSHGGWVIYRNTTVNTDKITIRLAGQSGASNTDYANTVTPVQNAWQHWAVVRSGTTLTWYCNGVACGVTTGVSTNIAETSTGGTMNIGRAQTWSTDFTGYLADVRVIKGSALYTSTFTPPTAPLTPVANTQLLTLQYNGGGSNNGFIDQSNLNNVITRVGNTTQGTFSPYSQTGWSTYFPSGANYITTTGTTIGTGPVTFEFWLYFTGDDSTRYDFIQGDSSNWLLYRGDVGTRLAWYTSTTRITANGFTQAAYGNRWVHIAVCRSGTTTKLFIDGIQAGSDYTGDTTNYSSSSMTIGKNAGGSFYMSGYISNYRIVTSALYTTSFTPPTSPLTAIAGTQILTCQSNRLIDNSPNNLALTITGTPSIQAYSPFGGTTSVPASYSTYFDGTGDNLTVGTTAISLPTATTPFTMEAWIYVTAFTGLSIMATNYSSGGIPFNLGLNNGTNTTASAGGYPFMSFYSGSTWTYAVQSTSANSTALSLNTWYHVAGVYSGTTAKIFVNGVETVSSNISSWQTTASAAGGINIGRKWDTSTPAYFSGYISNARLVIGTAVYTANFTPSTTPLTAIANTTMLTCQSATMIDNSTNNYAITGTGDAKPSTFNPFGTTTTKNVSYTPSVNGGSMYFDGVDDYLALPNSTNYNLTGDFTFECWVYPTATLANAWAILDARVNGQTAAPWSIGLANSTGYKLDLWTGTSYRGTKTINLNEWTHVVWTRSGSSLRSYVNGILDYNNASYGTGAISPGATTPWIGSKDNGIAGYDTQGYISDLRFTNGASLYTNNFVPPIQPLTPSTTIGSTLYNSTVLVNGTSGGIIDAHSSTSLETIGNVQLASEDPYSGNYYSVYFNGTNSYITMTPVLIPATGDFTIEFWLNSSTSAGSAQRSVFSQWGSGASGRFMFGLDQSSASRAWLHYNGTDYVSASNVITPGSWTHFALTRSSDTFTIYLNGTSVYTNTFAGASLYQISSQISGSGGSFIPNANISNLRVITGQSLFTGTFTPSTSPLTTTTVGHTGAGAASSIIGTVKLLTLKTRNFVDESINAYTLTRVNAPQIKSMNPFQQNTGKSLYFDGTGDWLQLPVTSSLYLGSGNFTIEGWINVPSVDATYRCIFSVGNTVQIYSRSGTIEMYFNDSDDTLSYMVNGQTGPANSIVANSWVHFAVVRNGTSWTAYVNGVAGTSVTAGGSVANSTSTPQVGAVLSTYPFSGYIKDLRVTKGIARYTATFTPPTIPFKSK